MPVFSVRAHRPNLDKPPHGNDFHAGLAEWGGFEPPGACAPAAFGTVAFDRSATTPLIHTKEQTGRRIRVDLVLPVGFEPTTGRVEAVCSDSTELQEQGGWPGGSRKIDNPFQRSNFALVICFQTGHPRLFGVVFSSAVRLQGSWNMPYLSIKEERNQARQSEEYPLKSFQSECEKVSTDSAP